VVRRSLGGDDLGASRTPGSAALRFGAHKQTQRQRAAEISPNWAIGAMLGLPDTPIPCPTARRPLGTWPGGGDEVSLAIGWRGEEGPGALLAPASRYGGDSRPIRRGRRDRDRARRVGLAQAGRTSPLSLPERDGLARSATVPLAVHIGPDGVATGRVVRVPVGVEGMSTGSRYVRRMKAHPLALSVSWATRSCPGGCHPPALASQPVDVEAEHGRASRGQTEGPGCGATT
jgi:hypothetical protein